MSEQAVSIEIPEPHYSIFETERAGLPAIVVVNDALLSFAKTDIFPWGLCVSLRAEEKSDNGIPSKNESDILFSIADEIESVASEERTPQGSINSLFIGRVTSGGFCDLLFQVHDPKIAHTSLQELLDSRSWKREWSYDMREDTGWANASPLLQLCTRSSGVIH
jgi:Family of unknown function (DUF695)